MVVAGVRPSVASKGASIPAGAVVTDLLPPAQRLDKWLWAARFFRTRALAAAAIRGGKVRHNGARCKPARPVSPGDALLVTRGEEVFDLLVTGLSERRLPAPRAKTLYAETEVSQARRAAEAEHRKVMRLARPDFGKRPDKRSRRRLRRASGKDPSS